MSKKSHIPQWWRKWKSDPDHQCGNCRGVGGSTPPVVALAYLSWGSDVIPTDRTYRLAIFMCHKNVKNTKFSCQHMDFLQLKMHQNPFSANSLGELTSYDAPPDPLVCCGGGHSCQRGSGTPPPHSPSASRSRRLRRLTSEPRVLFS